jgi:sigma-54 dependent transcriptional regulator
MSGAPDPREQMLRFCNLVALPRYEAVLTQSCALLAETFQGSSAILLLLDSTGRQFVTSAGFRPGDSHWAPPAISFPVGAAPTARSPLAQVAMTGRLLCVHRGAGYDLAPLAPLLGDPFSEQSTCFLPLTNSNGTLFGVFLLRGDLACPDRLSTQDSQRTLRAVATLIELRRNERTLAQQRSVLENYLSRADRDRDDLRHGHADRLRDMLPGGSVFMQDLRDKVRRLANFRHPILITGAVGLAKENVARALHKISRQSASPFVYVNAWTLNADTFAPELFGYKRGAIRGVSGARRGLLREAGDGMIYFDQIDALGPAEQTLLLRLLETRQFRALGSEREIEATPRMVFSTAVSLNELVAQGKFLPQLCHKISQAVVAITPLSGRREDIADVALHAVERLGGSLRRHLQLAPDTLTYLMGLDLPGNTRELEAMLEGASHRVDEDGVITVQHFLAVGGSKPLPDGQIGLKESVEQFESTLIRKTLEAQKNSRAQAAEILGIPKRTLADKCLKYGL